MLSQTSEYALRAAACLAREVGTPRTAQDLAAATRVPPGYLAKVLQQLVRAGIVRSRRGLGGGFELTRALERISVLDVLDAVDPIRRIDRCPLALPEHAGVLCALHRRLDDAYALVEETFRATALADLLRPPQRRGAPPAWPPPVASTLRSAPRSGSARGARRARAARSAGGPKRKASSK
jgi:Rrf2 family protein